MLAIDDLVTVKTTSPKYKYYKNRVGTVCQVPAIFVGASEDDVIVIFRDRWFKLECCFNKNELKKV